MRRRASVGKDTLTRSVAAAKMEDDDAGDNPAHGVQGSMALSLLDEARMSLEQKIEVRLAVGGVQKLHPPSTAGLARESRPAKSTPQQPSSLILTRGFR